MTVPSFGADCMSRKDAVRTMDHFYIGLRPLWKNFVPVCDMPTTMSDQIIDAAMARALHADACRDHVLVGWIVMKDPPDHPRKFTARLAASRPSPYVLIGDTLAAVQEQLPSGLVRSERQPGDSPEVVEMWFAE